MELSDLAVKIVQSIAKMDFVISLPKMVFAQMVVKMVTLENPAVKASHCSSDVVFVIFLQL